LTNVTVDSRVHSTNLYGPVPIMLALKNRWARSPWSLARIASALMMYARAIAIMNGVKRLPNRMTTVWSSGVSMVSMGWTCHDALILRARFRSNVTLTSSAVNGVPS
jgi:hypothetical protein